MKLTPFCNICGRLRAETTTGRLIVDHEHNTNYIRGWLCDLCNAYLSILERGKIVINKEFVLWYTTFKCRIEYHVNNPTNFLYKERRQFRKLYSAQYYGRV